VFSILLVGVLAATPGVAATAPRALARLRDELAPVTPRPLAPDGGVTTGVDPEPALRALTTGVATVALALGAYAVGYGVVG